MTRIHRAVEASMVMERAKALLGTERFELLMTYFELGSYRMVGELKGLSHATVSKRVNEALGQLRADLRLGL